MTVRLLNTLATWILLLRGVANSRGIRYKGAPSKAKENVRGRARPLLKANRNPMQPSSRIEALTSHSRDRRTKPRFDLSFPVLLRTGGEAWRPGRSQNVGAKGVFVLTDSPFMPRPNAEYVLRLPPELTKANQPLMIWFVGKVLRCESVHEGDFSYGIALQSRDYRYLPKEEVSAFLLTIWKVSGPSFPVKVCSE